MTVEPIGPGQVVAQTKAENELLRAVDALVNAAVQGGMSLTAAAGVVGMVLRSDAVGLEAGGLEHKLFRSITDEYESLETISPASVEGVLQMIVHLRTHAAAMAVMSQQRAASQAQTPAIAIARLGAAAALRVRSNGR